MKFSCVKMAEEVASGKSKTASKAKNTFSDEETENMISLWSEEEVLFLLLQIIRELKQPRRRRWVRRQVKNEFIFYERNSQLSRSVRFVNGSKIVLELNVQWRRVIPNGNTKY